MNYLKLIEALVADAAAVNGAAVGATVNIGEAASGLPDVSINVLGKTYKVDLSAAITRVS